MEDMPNTPEQLRELFNSLDLSGFNIKISLSAENMLDNFFSVERAMQLPLTDDSILVETSYFTPPYNLHGILDDIMSAGIYPVLAHPCRYEYMEERDYEKLREKRIRFQLNMPALGGLYGTGVQKKAMWLLSHGYYDITGTDTHSLKQYKLFLDSKLSRKCVKQLEELISK
jgi:tyrosine-protein phosphatase YwqE